MSKSTLPPESVLAFLRSLNPDLVVDDELRAALPSLGVTLQNFYPYVEKSEKASMGSGRETNASIGEGSDISLKLRAGKDAVGDNISSESNGSTSTSTLKSSITSDLLALWTSITSHPSVADLATLSSLASLLSTISPELAARLQLLIDEEKHELAEEAADAQYRTEEAKRAANERMMQEATLAMGMVFGRMVEEMRRDPRYAQALRDYEETGKYLNTKESKEAFGFMCKLTEDIKHVKTKEELDQIVQVKEASLKIIKQGFSAEELAFFQKESSLSNGLKGYKSKYGLYKPDSPKLVEEIRFFNDTRQRVLDCDSREQARSLLENADEKTAHCILAAASNDAGMCRKLFGDLGDVDRCLEEVGRKHPGLMEKEMRGELKSELGRVMESASGKLESSEKSGDATEKPRPLNTKINEKEVQANKGALGVVGKDREFKVLEANGKLKIHQQNQALESKDNSHFAEKIPQKPLIESSRRRTNNSQSSSTPSL